MKYLIRLRVPSLTLLRFAWAAVAACVVALAGCANVPGSEGGGQAPKNIIIMVADGAAPTQWDFGRYSSKVLRGQSFVTTDIVFKRGTLGLLITSPADAYVTDSAAAGSAMATGFRVNNGVVSVTPDGQSIATAMEAARAKGKRIGLVTTATIYDATPAAFSIHAKSRRDSQALVDQFLALEPEVLMGGGADYFLPAGVPGGETQGRQGRGRRVPRQGLPGGEERRGAAGCDRSAAARPVCPRRHGFRDRPRPGEGADRRRDGSSRAQGARARQPGFYWGTSGHTPEPVLVGAMGPGAELFRGYQDNTDFGRHLHRLINGR